MQYLYWFVFFVFLSGKHALQLALEGGMNDKLISPASVTQCTNADGSRQHFLRPWHAFMCLMAIHVVVAAPVTASVSATVTSYFASSGFGARLLIECLELLHAPSLLQLTAI